MKAAILRAFGRQSQAAPWDNEESIREELFSIEEGTGIGLVMSKRVVELMGGVIGVESTGRGGSVFWIELVVAAAPQLAVFNYLTKTIKVNEFMATLDVALKFVKTASGRAAKKEHA